MRNEEASNVVSRDALLLPCPYREPASATESAIAAIWQDQLNVDRIGLDDDFFELGGDSLAAVDIALAISERFSVDFKPGLLFEINSVGAVSKWLEADGHESGPGNLICYRKAGGGAPIFLIHGMFGVTLPRPEFLQNIDRRHAVYAFQVRGFDGKDEPFQRLEKIAQDYLASILKVQPDPPWCIVAFCEGGWIAFELVRQMQEIGIEPQSVILLDPMLRSLRLDAEFAGSRVSLFGRQSGALSRLVSSLTFRLTSQRRKIRMFRKTGIWADPKLAGALDDPRVANHLLALREKRAGRFSAELDGGASKDGEAGGDLAAARFEMHDRFDVKSATRASVLLQNAFWNYCPPRPVDYRFDLVLASGRDKPLTKQMPIVRKYLPNCTIIHSGVSHEETIATTTWQNSERIQKLIDRALVMAERD